MHAIDRLTIKGYKSIRSLENFEMRRLNVLIGANGAGKSNFVGFFRLLRNLIEQRLQLALAVEGGADVLLFMGSKMTWEVDGRFDFGADSYSFSLIPTSDNRFTFSSEEAIHTTGDGEPHVHLFTPGLYESRLKDTLGFPTRVVFESLSSWVVYHFHDTSPLAPVRRQHAINDDEYLREDAANLPSFLYRIRTTHPDHYQRIRQTVRMAAPFFDDFKLRPVSDKPHLTQLEWLQIGSDYPFGVHQLSDGTLRFICLTTALMQPSMPATILFDEPELGLHPHALALLGALFHKAAGESQIVISTQSPALLNEFEPEDIIVVERVNGESIFQRLDRANFSEWLEESSIGDLWQKNVLGGGPHEDRFFEPVAGAVRES